MKQAMDSSEQDDDSMSDEQSAGDSPENISDESSSHRRSEKQSEYDVSADMMTLGAVV
ncbi:unnamed protein product, partial [Linum tenue]